MIYGFWILYVQILPKPSLWGQLIARFNIHLAENDSIGFLHEGMLKSNLTTMLDESHIKVYFKKVLIVIRLILFEKML